MAPQGKVFLWTRVINDMVVTLLNYYFVSQALSCSLWINIRHQVSDTDLKKKSVHSAVGLI